VFYEADFEVSLTLQNCPRVLLLISVERDWRVKE